MTDIRNVVYIIGAALLLSVASIAILAGTSDRPTPDVLQNVAVGSLTGLVGLLVPAGNGAGGRRRRAADIGPEAGASELVILLVCVGVGLVVLDLFVGPGAVLSILGVVLIAVGLVFALLRR